MAKSAKVRKQEQRERDRRRKENHEVLVLSRKIELPLYRKTDEILIRAMQRARITEPQDLITRLLHASDLMTDEEFSKHIDIF